MKRRRARFDTYCHLVTTMTHVKLSAELTRISEARHHDPFSVLGRQQDGEQVLVRVFNPHATEMFIAEGGLPLQRLPGSDFFEWRGQGPSCRNTTG